MCDFFFFSCVQVVAIDEDEPSFRSTATVTITIKDTNDNSPTFQHDTFRLRVSEHSPAGTIVANITVRPKFPFFLTQTI